MTTKFIYTEKDEAEIRLLSEQILDVIDGNSVRHTIILSALMTCVGAAVNVCDDLEYRRAAADAVIEAGKMMRMKMMT